MDRKLLRCTALWGAGWAVLIALFFLFLDRPIDLAARGLKGGALHNAAQALSQLASHDLFNALLLTAYLFIGVRALGRGVGPGLRRLIYICLAVTIAMAVGESLKWLLGRYRPVMLFEQGLYGFSFLADAGRMHSFPSGHTFRIFSAATAASLLWPRGRWALLTLAALVGVSRVVVTRHYPSDVLAGALVGVVCAVWVWRVMAPERDDAGAGAPPQS